MGFTSLTNATTNQQHHSAISPKYHTVIQLERSKSSAHVHQTATSPTSATPLSNLSAHKNSVTSLRSFFQGFNFGERRRKEPIVVNKNRGKGSKLMHVSLDPK